MLENIKMDSFFQAIIGQATATFCGYDCFSVKHKWKKLWVACWEHDSVNVSRKSNRLVWPIMLSAMKAE
jgi:hypothetical protein